MLGLLSFPDPRSRRDVSRPDQGKGREPMRNHRRIALGAALLPLAVLAAACGSGGGGNSNTPSSTSIGQGKTITVGVSGDFSESKILAEMYGQVLANAGFNVK